MVLESSSQNQRRTDAPEVVVARLPQYVRILTRLLQEGAEVVSSQHLGEQLQVTPAQLRKDLSYFGRFGKQGRGYSVLHLLERLKLILGLNSFWNVAVVGVGRLGRAILSYPGFTPDGFHIVAAFDANPDEVLRQALLLGLCTTVLYDPTARALDPFQPVALPGAVRRRRVLRMNAEYFHALYQELIEENPFAVRAVLKVLQVEFTETVPTPVSNTHLTLPTSDLV